MEQKHVHNILNQVLTDAGFNPKYYGMHAMHAGHAQDLLLLGLSIEMIKKIGRWKSNCVYTYLK